MIDTIISKIIGKINQYLRFIRVNTKRYYTKIDKSLERCVICNNCVGAMVLHDFGLKFQSPFVNLFIEPDDYLKVLNNMDRYLKKGTDLQDITGESRYPIGLLGGDVKIHFLHYDSFDEAREKWNLRLDRMMSKELYIIFVSQEGCLKEHLTNFSNLQYDNKIALVNHKSNLNESEGYISGFEDKPVLGIITDYKGISGKRYYDDFDWRKFLKL